MRWVAIVTSHVEFDVKEEAEAYLDSVEARAALAGIVVETSVIWRWQAPDHRSGDPTHPATKNACEAS